MVFRDPREEKLQPKAKLRDVGRKSTHYLPTGHCTIFEDKLLTWRLTGVSQTWKAKVLPAFHPRSRVLPTIALLCLRDNSLTKWMGENGHWEMRMHGLWS